ncbi:MAG: glycogen debranching enzyme family protein [Fimbriimonadaceae bacterium]|nr:glycogen debranching enzyme family protein [Fimbriimonadaceae bacterium]
MRYVLDANFLRDYSKSSQLEWMLPNGTGGFAMGTVAGSATRRYHGYLVAAVKPPTDRMVLLPTIESFASAGGQSFGLSTNEYVGTVHPQGFQYLESFAQGGNFVEWIHAVGGGKLRRRLAIHEGEEATTIAYTNVGSTPLQLTLRPLVCHKPYHENFRVMDFYPEFIVFPDERTVISHQGVTLSIEHPGAIRTPTTGWYYRFERKRESERGLDPIDDLFCPCELRYVLGPGEEAVLVAATTEGVRPISMVEEPPTTGIVASLERSAREFLVETPERTTIIAGYPWFTDWGRDTMISLPGICLCTGRIEQARAILRAYASQMEHGLLPNRFVHADEAPEYNTADATLWFANAIYKTLIAEWEEGFAQEALVWLKEALEWHLKGTLYGIRVDPADGLLTQGAPGVQLTWMDAKVGDWVVTPRHGKPIEVNGLWINLLRVGEWLANRLGEDGSAFSSTAEKAELHFEAKFWHPVLGHYLDTVDPADASLRPNQIIAMGLPFSPIKGENGVTALSKAKNALLTRHGLRTLAPTESGYRGRYEGPLSERDASYHQGTSWPWLLGSLASAIVRLTGDKSAAQKILDDAGGWLAEYGLGGIAEVYDGDEPQFPGGCPWQAWSIAEVLRSYIEDIGIASASKNVST